jgi:hypothetical protein
MLATSMTYSDDFSLFPKDVGFPLINTLGTQTDLIRSDVLIHETSRGGRVLGVGTISWYCNFAWEWV